MMIYETMNSPIHLNQHPAVMFEIMATDQAALNQFYKVVFGWQADPNGGFDYIKFPVASRPLLGGIGKAKPGVIGWEKGVTFYLEVPSIDQALEDRIKNNGGKMTVPRTPVDGYVFGMFEDPEKNLVGLIEPFKDTA